MADTESQAKVVDSPPAEDKDEQKKAQLKDDVKNAKADMAADSCNGDAAAGGGGEEDKEKGTSADGGADDKGPDGKAEAPLGPDALRADQMGAIVSRILQQDDQAAKRTASPVPRKRTRAKNFVMRQIVLATIHLNRHLVEFLGSFMLTLTALLVGSSSPIIGPVAVGSILMSAVFAGGHISGGHYNPSVTLAVFCSGRGIISVKQALWYWFAQFLGGFCAGLTTYYLISVTTVPRPTEEASAGQAFVAEMIFSFFLSYVVLNVATTKSTENNSFYGLAIGFTVLAGASCCGRISGGFFNPAIAIGGGIITDCAVTGECAGRYTWVYLIAPLVGGALAALFYRFSSYTSEYAIRTVVDAHLEELEAAQAEEEAEEKMKEELAAREKARRIAHAIEDSAPELVVLPQGLNVLSTRREQTIRNLHATLDQLEGRTRPDMRDRSSVDDTESRLERQIERLEQREADKGTAGERGTSQQGQSPMEQVQALLRYRRSRNAADNASGALSAGSASPASGGGLGGAGGSVGQSWVKSPNVAPLGSRQESHQGLAPRHQSNASPSPYLVSLGTASAAQRSNQHLLQQQYAASNASLQARAMASPVPRVHEYTPDVVPNSAGSSNAVHIHSSSPPQTEMTAPPAASKSQLHLPAPVHL